MGLGIIAQSGAKMIDKYRANIRVAYSLRKLSSVYAGSAIRVREGGFNSETDIGFDSNGELDTTALLAHCASNGTGFITKWYDQSGNGGDLVQTTTAQQPKIVSDNAVFVDNGKPMIIGQDNINGTFLSISGTKSTYFPTTGQHYFFSVCKANTPRSILYREDTRFQLIAQDGNTSTNTRNDPNYLSDTYRKNTATYSPTNRGEVYTSFQSQTLVTINGSLTHTINSFALGYGSSNFDAWDMQEFIVYEGDKSNIQSGLEKEINNYYRIF